MSFKHIMTARRMTGTIDLKDCYFRKYEATCQVKKRLPAKIVGLPCAASNRSCTPRHAVIRPRVLVVNNMRKYFLYFIETVDDHFRDRHGGLARLDGPIAPNPLQVVEAYDPSTDFSTGCGTRLQPGSATSSVPIHPQSGRTRSGRSRLHAGNPMRLRRQRTGRRCHVYRTAERLDRSATAP